MDVVMMNSLKFFHHHTFIESHKNIKRAFKKLIRGQQLEKIYLKAGVMKNP
jgi:hypothetical protein